MNEFASLREIWASLVWAIESGGILVHRIKQRKPMFHVERLTRQREAARRDVPRETYFGHRESCSCCGDSGVSADNQLRPRQFIAV